MRERTLYSVCSLALLIWGCPKRQTTPRIVYIPSPPSAAEQSPAPASGTLVIEEPLPPEPAEVVPEEQPPEQKPVRRRRRAVSPERPAIEPAEDAVEPPPGEVPALEPRESPAQQTALRQQVLGIQAGIRSRIAQLKQVRLSDLEKKTLDDAQMFLEQSQRAFETNDLVRALNLARKASLLVNTLE